MPKMNCDIQDRRVGQEKYVHVAPRGFIDSSSCRFFERALDGALRRKARFCVLDLAGVHYINSTGISVIIRHFGLYKERDGLFVLSAVPKSVGLSMHLLGVTSLIPFHKDVDAATAQFRKAQDGAFEFSKASRDLEADLRESARGKKKIFVPLRRRPSPVGDAKILLLIPKKGRFSRILGLRFGALNGNFSVLHDTEMALERMEELQPDLVVLDDRLDRSGEFVTRLKLHPRRSLISLIKIYSVDTRVDEAMDFKIWENDYLVDPFEILELFSLSEAELLRVPKDRKIFQQQMRVEFRTTRSNVEKLNTLSDMIIRSALEGEEDRTAMIAAVKEGVDNAVRHGNNWKDDRKIDVNFLVDRKKLTCIVQDAGSGFDFEYYLSRLDDQESFERVRKNILEQEKRGGLGILLMHRCTDRIDYSGTGNILRLEKNLARA